MPPGRSKPTCRSAQSSASGFGGAVERVTTVNWGSTSPQGKRYLWRVYDDGPETYKTLSMSHAVVTGITLPNNLSYQFQYNSDAFDPNNPTKSVGWGEMSQATLPTGAVVKYGYTMNNRHDEYDPYGPVEPKDVLKNYPQSKQLTYAVTFDGTGTQRTDTWGYSLAFGFFDEVVTGQVAGPDGGVTREHFYPDNGSTSNDRDASPTRPSGRTARR